MEAPHHRTVVAVDLDQTLAKLLESVLEWHNAEEDSKVRFERTRMFPGQCQPQEGSLSAG